MSGNNCQFCGNGPYGNIPPTSCSYLNLNGNLNGGSIECRWDDKQCSQEGAQYFSTLPPNSHCVEIAYDYKSRQTRCICYDKTPVPPYKYSEDSDPFSPSFPAEEASSLSNYKQNIHNLFKDTKTKELDKVLDETNKNCRIIRDRFELLDME